MTHVYHCLFVSFRIDSTSLVERMPLSITDHVVSWRHLTGGVFFCGCSLRTLRPRQGRAFLLPSTWARNLTHDCSRLCILKMLEVGGSAVTT